MDDGGETRTEESMPPMNVKQIRQIVGKEVVVAVVGVLLTVVFEFVTLGYVRPEEFEKVQKNHAEVAKVLAVQFDLYIVSLSLVLGWATSRQVGGKHFQYLTLTFLVGLLLLLALPAVAKITPEHLSNWFRIWLPDILGFVMIWIAARTVGRT